MDTSVIKITHRQTHVGPQLPFDAKSALLHVRLGVISGEQIEIAQIEVIESTSGTLVDMAWSPDGSQLAYVGSDTGLEGGLPQIVTIGTGRDFTIPASDVAGLITPSIRPM